MSDRGTYKGHLILRWDAGDEECRKYAHDVYTPGSWSIGGPYNTTTTRAKCRTLDLSPYCHNGLDLAAAMIDLDFPKRETIGIHSPLTESDVERLWKEKFGDKPMPKAEII